MEQKFYICPHCGNIIVKIKDCGVIPFCCGEKMHELIPFAKEGAKEKHIPIVNKNGNNIEVIVGSIEHPMTEEHFIEWVFLQTKFGNQFQRLTPSSKPVALFSLTDGDEVEAVYSFCNLHGLWKN